MKKHARNECESHASKKIHRRLLFLLEKLFLDSRSSKCITAIVVETRGIFTRINITQTKTPSKNK